MATVADLMGEAEKADDAYAQSVLSAARARADYELGYYKALATCPAVITSVAARKEWAEKEANDQHRLFLLAEASEKAARTHVQVILGLLVAAQSVQKFQGKQDGGGDWETW